MSTQPTQNEILAMAKEAGIVTGENLLFAEGQRYRSLGAPCNVMQEHLEKFAELIVNHAIECVRDVLREEDSELTYTAASQVQSVSKNISELNDERTNSRTC